nr:9208_t:CDS:2 [Entrophospora candida]
MSPRTSSPPPCCYEINTNNGANPNDNSGSLNALLPRSFNIPKTVFSSAVIQFFSLMMIYSFCITALWMVFCTSYLLTFYDDSRRIFCTSRVWARVKNGVRERIAMFGEDWEDFFQKYFDQWDGVDGNKNGHLGDTDWEDWLKSRMFKFVTAVAGPNIADKFKQSASTCQSQQHKK